MITLNRFNRFVKYAIVLCDIIVLNIMFLLLYEIKDIYSSEVVFSGSLFSIMGKISVSYFVCTYSTYVIDEQTALSIINIVRRISRSMALFSFLIFSLLIFADGTEFSYFFFIGYFVISYFTLILVRLLIRDLITTLTNRRKKSIKAIFLGSSNNLLELYNAMQSAATINFTMEGYFDREPNERMNRICPYLGKPEEALSYIQEHREIDHVYCAFPSSMKDVIIPIINYCENNIIRFYSVPNVRNYLHHKMYFKLMGNVPLLSLHNDPLAQSDSKLLKRIFDIVISSTFLMLFYPIIYPIFAIAIKLSSPGPVFFKQKRNGLNGREFECYKFRSMKVNADSDKIQATKDDPRKTKIGDFMRRTNIDELPQFINVWKGDMSIVGPRPHMVKHTEEYSKLIDKYMVRHFIKPGITGWAQVSGFRGETKEIEQMEGRIQADIWYMEHWSLWLDMYIMWKTGKNMVCGDKEAY